MSGSNQGGSSASTILAPGSFGSAIPRSQPLYNPDTSILAGMTQPQLQAALSAAQTALLALQSGGKVQTVSYSQGDGSRSVSYTQASIPGLTALIMQIQRQLSPHTRRRALRPIF